MRIYKLTTHGATSNYSGYFGTPSRESYLFIPVMRSANPYRYLSLSYTMTTLFSCIPLFMIPTHHYNSLIKWKIKGDIASANIATKRQFTSGRPGLGIHPFVTRYSFGLHEFLELDEKDFLDKAYLAILKRAPDRDGYTHYRTTMAKGASRREILSLLRYSDEGARIAVSVNGLNGRLLYRSLYRPKALVRGLVRKMCAARCRPDPTDEK